MKLLIVIGLLSAAFHSCSCLAVTDLRLYHFDPSRDSDFFDASTDANSPQVLELTFSLDETESFDNVLFQHGDDDVATFDQNGNYQVSPPFDAVGLARIGVNPSSGFGRLSFTSSDLSYMGNWSVVVESDADSVEYTKEFGAYMKCTNGYAWDVQLDLDTCQITYGSYCDGTLYPEPTVADVGLVSSVYDGYVSSGSMVSQENPIDGSFSLSVSDLTYTVDDSTPKLLNVLVDVAHGTSDENIIDRQTVSDTAGLEMLDAYGCSKMQDYCQSNSPTTIQPFLPNLDGDLDPNLTCSMTGDSEEVPSYDAAPCRDEIRPVDVNGKLTLTFECGAGCQMGWNFTDSTRDAKTLECRRDSYFWQEVEEEDGIMGFWPYCDCGVTAYDEEKIFDSAVATVPTFALFLAVIMAHFA